MLDGLDHVQLAMLTGGEERARAYFGGLLGLMEIEKPAALAGRGGVWFGLPDGWQIHLGVEEPFQPDEKAHPAFLCSTLDDLVLRDLRRVGMWRGGTKRWRPGGDSTARTLLGTGSSSSSRRLLWRDIIPLAS